MENVTIGLTKHASCNLDEYNIAFIFYLSVLAEIFDPTHYLE